MTAGESATPNFDFDSIVYGSGMVDPGMVDCMDTIAAVERAMNAEGGQASVGYDSALHSIDEEWPQHGVSAKISGRLYLFGDIADADVLDKAVQLWGEPTRDGDDVYWDVSDTELVSRGVVDDGADSRVALVCAYSFGDDALTSFTTRPGESVATYDRLTRRGNEHYLRREWAELVETIDRHLPETSFDTGSILDLSRAICEKYQNALRADDGKFRVALSEYITDRAQFSERAAYVLVLEGPLKYFDDEGSYTTVQISEKTLEYVYRPTVVFQKATKEVGVAMVAEAGEGLDDSNLMVIPATTICEFRPTYTGVSLLDRVGIVRDHEAGSGSVEIYQPEFSAREERLEHLRNIQTEILYMVEQAQHLTANSYDSPEEALEVAESGLYSLQSQAEAVGLDDCILVVDGEDVTLPPSRHEFNRSSDGSLSIQSIGELAPMEPGDQRSGRYSDLQASYRIIEEDGEEVYYPCISMRLHVSSHLEETMHANEVAMTDVVVNSYIYAPLETATIAIERLDTEELIDQTLTDLDREGETNACGLLETIYADVFDQETEELADATIVALHDLAESSARQTSETVVKAIVTVIDGIFSNQTVALNTTEDKNELVAGKIVDVRYERSSDFPPEGLVLTLVAEDDSLHTVAADSIKTVVLRGAV